MKRSILFHAGALLALWAGANNSALGQQGYGTTLTGTTVTNANGTIAQLNYGENGEVQGFLIGTNILLMLPPKLCGGVSGLGAVGNSVTYSGTAYTATSGFQSVMVSSFTNNTTKATYTAPTSASTAYGPTSGTVKQLNYAGDGSIDGFLFLANGSSANIFVSIGPRSSSSLTSILTVGATVSVTGTTSPNMSGCSSTGALQSVDASSLIIGSTTIVISGGYGGGPGRFGGPGPGGPH